MIRKSICKKFGESSLSIRPYSGTIVKFFSPMKLITIKLDKGSATYFQGMSWNEIIDIIQSFDLDVHAKDFVLVTGDFDTWEKLSWREMWGGGPKGAVSRLLAYSMTHLIKGLNPRCTDFESVGDLTNFITKISIASKKWLAQNALVDPVYFYFTHSHKASHKVRKIVGKCNQFDIEDTLVPTSLVAFEEALDGQLVQTATSEIEVVQKWIEFERARDIFNASLIKSGLSTSICESDIVVTAVSTSRSKANEMAKQMINSGSEELFLIGIKIKGVVNDAINCGSDC